MKSASISYSNGNRTVNCENRYMSRKEIKEAIGSGRVVRTISWFRRRVKKPHGARRPAFEKRKIMKRRSKLRISKEAVLK